MNEYIATSNILIFLNGLVQKIIDILKPLAFILKVSNSSLHRCDLFHEFPIVNKINYD
jgi:hypothetical protein